ncbi:hypothetical protein HDV00_009758 [Rhizophlyctis rosea]|nr:hypothetical protein HDV00_009758 [Rhizophlyctis rosea]
MTKQEFEQFKSSASSFGRNLPSHAKNYVKELFPIFGWLPRYNRTWLAGDVIAGLTVGMIVIPQALSYATVAGLPVQYGLFTMFFGTIFYSWFATSKDVTIGATAVLSLVVGQVSSSYNADKAVDPVVFASCMALIAGIVQLVLGMFRLGLIVDFIPAPVIVGFCTGSGVQIIAQQMPGMLGVPGVNTNDPAFRVIINIFKNIKNTAGMNAAFGVPTLAFILFMKFGTEFLTRRGYKWAKWVGLTRNGVALILFTLISYVVNKDISDPKKFVMKTVGVVPRGFNAPVIPDLTKGFSNMLSASVTVIIVSILEHVAIVKSYGRLNGYVPKPNQELVAIGLTNIVASFFGAYPATGSFSRSSIKSQSGVKTPAAGLLVGAIVILAVYVLTPAYLYIPSASICAIIMAAVTELVSPPSVPKQLWEIKFVDLFTFVLAFAFTFFTTVEIAIYVSVAFAVAVLLYRIARPKLALMGKLPNHNIWVPFDEAGLGEYAAPAPAGVLVFRLDESLTYPNSGHVADKIRETVIQSTIFGGEARPASERLWSDDTEERAARFAHSDESKKIPKSILHAIVFDMSPVNHTDSTGVQTLVDLRRDVDRFAGKPVLFIFAHVKPSVRPSLEYFLSITHKDVTPALPEQPEGTLTPASKVGRYFYLTVDQAVQAVESGSVGGADSSAGTIGDEKKGGNVVEIMV